MPGNDRVCQQGQKCFVTLGPCVFPPKTNAEFQKSELCVGSISDKMTREVVCRSPEYFSQP